MADLTSLGAKPLPDLIYAWLREQIFSGVLSPGTVLRQEQLAKRFNVSRVPLREAFSRLQAEGLIQLRPRRGFAVISLNPSEIVQIFELRMVIEEFAVTVATRSRSGTDIAEVARCLDKMEALDPAAPGYLLAWSALNRDFHAQLIGSARRQRLSEIAMNLRVAVEPYIRLESHLTGDMDQAETEHRAIFAAFRDGDAALAGRLSREHCESTMQRVIATIRAGQSNEPIAPGFAGEIKPPILLAMEAASNDGN
jgi:DNA-binding GntR family transcriptional regulator